MTQENSKDASRRNVLKALGATGALAAFGGVASAQETTQEGGQTVPIQGTPIFMGGEAQYWYGLYPGGSGETTQEGGGSSLNVQGKENPTLNLTSGEQYTIVWVNLDGAPHNVVFADSDGNNIQKSTIIESQGAIQYVSFTAESNMAEYYCEVHAQSMRGKINVGGN